MNSCQHLHGDQPWQSTLRVRLQRWHLVSFLMERRMADVPDTLWEATPPSPKLCHCRHLLLTSVTNWLPSSCTEWFHHRAQLFPSFVYGFLSPIWRPSEINYKAVVQACLPNFMCLCLLNYFNNPMITRRYIFDHSLPCSRSFSTRHIFLWLPRLIFISIL